MKIRTLTVLATLAFALFTASCGGKGKGGPQTDTTQTAQQTKEPYADSPLNNNYTANLGGHAYDIRIARHADKTLPVVHDDMGAAYYDNRVDVTITRDGEAFFSHAYTKEAFADFLSANESRGTVLLGMAYDPERSNAQAIHIGAQIGQIGIEEGPAFSVEIPLDGGTASITRDKNQDTSGDDSMGD